MNNSNDEIEEIEEELFEHFRFDVPKGQLLLRIDKFLMNLIPNATRNKIQNAASAGDIYVNDVPVKSNYRVKPLDVVRIMLSHPPFENRVDPENIPLNIVYEDDAHNCYKYKSNKINCPNDKSKINIIPLQFAKK